MTTIKQEETTKNIDIKLEDISVNIPNSISIDKWAQLIEI